MIGLAIFWWGGGRGGQQSATALEYHFNSLKAKGTFSMSRERVQRWPISGEGGESMADVTVVVRAKGEV